MKSEIKLMTNEQKLIKGKSPKTGKKEFEKIIKEWFGQHDWKAEEGYLISH